MKLEDGKVYVLNQVFVFLTTLFIEILGSGSGNVRMLLSIFKLGSQNAHTFLKNERQSNLGPCQILVSLLLLR